MKYTVHTLAELTGLSKRTLRYYDEIGLFKARREAENDYRVYFSEDLDKLQLIMLLRRMNMSISEIEHVMQHAQLDMKQILITQKEKLLAQQKALNTFIALIDETMANEKEGKIMTDQNKFKVFKQEKMEQNRKQFGKEVEAEYGEHALEQTERHWQHLSELEYNQAVEYENTIKSLLIQLADNQEIQLDDNVCEKVYKAHAKWLELMSGQYSKAYHRSMAELYVNDERFAEYYVQLTGKDNAAVLLSRMIMFHAK